MKPIAQLLSRDGAQPVRAMPARAVSARLVTGLAVLTASLILTACGGGGGGGGGSSAPSSGSGSTPPATTSPGGTTTTPPSTGGGTTTTPPSSGGGTTTPPTGSTPSNPVATVNLKADATAVAGQPVTLTWISSDTGASSCTISGDYSATVATSGTQQVTTKSSTSAYTASYTITCGSATSTASVNVTPPVPTNIVQMTMDTGPDGSDNNAINVPYVSVTICKPGTTQCETIDHIMVDTGSFGLRIVKPLPASLGLAPVTTSSGAAVGECGQFVSGFTWGSVLQADVKIGSEVAANQSIQVVDGAVGSVPQACSDKGETLGTVKALGANGVLGIGLYKQDCGQKCADQLIDAAYYACTSSGCTPTKMPVAQQVSNPVAAFPVDNNGVVITYPNVATGGGTVPVGTLIFGIGTQSNNGLNGTTQYPVDGNGNFKTVYKGQTLPDSFLDTGSNGLFFPDSSLPMCSFNTDFYCPSSPLSLSATVSTSDGSVSSTVNFTLESIDALPKPTATFPGTPFGWVGGPGSGSKANTSFDWGLPFFFGRKVYIGMEGSNTAPYWAF